MSENINKFLGSGLAYPVIIDSKGSPVIAKGIELIRSSIINILSWPLNQRFFLPQFGSMINFLIEEPNDILLRGLVRYYIEESLNQWEPRINILDITFQAKNEMLNCEITYSVINSEIEDTFVYPFYRKIEY